LIKILDLNKPYQKIFAVLILAAIASTTDAQDQKQDQKWRAERVVEKDSSVSYRLRSPASVSNTLHMAVLWDDSCTPYALLLIARTEAIANRNTIPARIDFTAKHETILSREVDFSEERAKNWTTLSLYPYPEDIEAMLDRAAAAGEAVGVTVWGDNNAALLKGGMPVRGLLEAVHKIEERCLQDRLATERGD
jgi:hypothetical protein